MSAASTTKGEQTRAAILEAAHDLFITQGYNAASMRRIAQAAGIALGGIYNHFASKEAIFKAVFYANHPFLEMIPAIETAEGDTVTEFVQNAAKQMMSAMQKRPDFLNLMFIEIVEFNNVHAQEVFYETFPRGIDIVKKLSSKDGNIRPFPTPMLIRIFIGLFFSYYLAETILGEIAPLEFRQDAMETYVDVFLHGILDT